MRLIAIEGNTQKLDGGAMFGNAPRPLWEKWIAPDSLGRIPLACRSMLIQHEGKTVLFEAGIGGFFEPALAERYGVQTPERHLLLEGLNKIGLKEENIDAVVLSHLHFDHAGGILPPYKEIQETGYRLLFPNAQFFVGKKAWERAERPHSRDRASFIPEIQKLLSESGRLTLVEGEKTSGLWPECLTFFTTDGHTPGHLHSMVKGAKETVVFAGDLIPGIAWVHLPITMGYDRFPELVIDEKTKFYKDAVAQGTFVFYTHDVKTAMSRIVKNEKGRFEPVDLTPAQEWIDI